MLCYDVAMSTKPTDQKEKQLKAVESSLLFEDNRFIVLNKPSGMAVHGGSGESYGVIEALRALRPKAPYLELVHRLDKDTSGVLVVAKRKSALRAFQKQQELGKVSKHYLTLVRGQWQGGRRKISAPLLKTTLPSGERVVTVDGRGKDAASLFSSVNVYANTSLMRVELLTGRTHQIRVHAAHSGHPIAQDTKYGDEMFNQEMEQLGLNRLFLHAQSIVFSLPEVGDYQISAPLCSELQTVLEKLKK